MRVRRYLGPGKRQLVGAVIMVTKFTRKRLHVGWQTLTKCIRSVQACVRLAFVSKLYTSDSIY